jgi:hypothetical protein
MATKELFLICALAIPGGSFTHPKMNPNNFDIYRLFCEVLSKEYFGRYPRVLLIKNRTTQSVNGESVRALENHPPWKSRSFDAILRLEPYQQSLAVFHRLSLYAIDRTLKIPGFFIADIRFHPVMAGTFEALGYQKIPAVLYRYSLFGKFKPKGPLIFQETLPTMIYSSVVGRPSRLFQFLNVYLKYNIGREPRLLYSESSTHFQRFNLKYLIEASELRPPWKTAAFDIVMRVREFHKNDYFLNRQIIKAFDRVLSTQGFFIVDIRKVPELAEFFKQLGYRKTPFQFNDYTIFQKWFRHIPMNYRPLYASA